MKTARVVSRRYHLHVPGVVYAIITVLLVVGAMQGQNNLLLWLFGLAVSGLAISGFMSGSSLMNVEVERRVVGPGRAGGALVVEYRVRNRSRVAPGLALVVEELASGPGGKHRSTWSEFMPAARAAVVHVPRRGEVVVRAEVIPWGRGVATFDALRISTTAPLGLTLKSVVFSQPSRVAIRPWTPAMSRGAWRALEASGDRVERTLERRGHDLEFFALREYVPGDARRLIAWRSSAKRGSLVVRESASRRGEPMWLAPVPTGAEKERVLSLTGALARAASEAESPVGLLGADGRVVVRPGTGARHVERVLDALAVWDEGGEARAWARPSRTIVVMGGTSGGIGDRVARVEDVALVSAEEWSRMPRRTEGPPARAWWKQWLAWGSRREGGR